MPPDPVEDRDEVIEGLALEARDIADVNHDTGLKRKSMLIEGDGNSRTRIILSTKYKGPMKETMNVGKRHNVRRWVRDARHCRRCRPERHVQNAWLVIAVIGNELSRNLSPPTENESAK